MSDGSSDWKELEAALDRLLDANPPDRQGILDELDARDPRLAQRVGALLQFALDENVLPGNITDAAPEFYAALTEEDVRGHLGERLGPYRIVEVISRGGMGVVFRGERADGAFEQSVAIKVIPASIASERASALFDRERQYLARLEHPNIARIIDAGVTQEDTPYYVMEFVDGVTIEDHIRDSEMRPAAILAYFLQLCDAVAYCHRSMIVHGDIKPGNVLVADDRVRLVDFGIGRLLEESTRDARDSCVHAYSPGYAAPEQERGEPATIQSDVYSLGAILRSMLGNVATADIDAIVARCTADDPSERYESVTALRDDVRNYLGGYTVSAREQTRRYRTGKFVRRNKLLVGATIAVLVSLGIGLASALWQYDIARTQAQRAEQVKNFLTSLFAQADPLVAGERDVTLREIVADAAARLDSELDEQPEVRAELMLLIGNAYFGIGDYDRALALHERALAQWRTEVGKPSIDVVIAMNAVGGDYSKRGEYGKAEALHRQALEQLNSLGLPNSVHAVDSWTQLGASLVQTAPAEAREAMLQAHQINLQFRSNDQAAIARSLANIATGYRAERNIEESAKYHEQALAIAEQNGERLAPDILSIRCNLALDYGTLGRHEEARAAQTVCNELTVERFGRDHPANIPNLNNLGALDIRMGKLIDAERIYLEANRIAEEKLPPMSLERMAVEINHAVVLWHSGRARLAEPLLRELLQRMEGSVGVSHPASGRVRSLLGRVILENGDAAKAERFLQTSLQGMTPYWRSDALLWLAEANLELGKHGEAAALAAESLELRQSIPHFTAWQVSEAELLLGQATCDDEIVRRASTVLDTSLPDSHFRRKLAR